MSENLLCAETSPYLLQHKDNPVHWRPWSAEALAFAAAENKPILLSVGYAACHWCHVMAHESFEDAETADLMNRLFVNIKVDREERPDLDSIYQSALALLGQQGGWPLTMFLTPKGEPFWGGTYFPPSARFGRPGFKEVLTQVAEAYRQRPEQVGKNVAALKQALHELSQAEAGDTVTIELTDRMAERLCREVDPFHGGLGTAPKFPQGSSFELIWRAWKRTGQQPYRQAVMVTLNAMCQGGIYDHLGGGFARYATDQHWLVPHFEKMLYDNAQLIDLLTLVWQDGREPLFADRVAETVAWLLREMRLPDGGFAGTLDADSEGEEGRYYVWTESEVDALLGPRAAAFKAAYDVRPQGNWEGKTILHRRRAPEPSDAEAEVVLAQCRAVLFEARSKRVPPARDDKVLADWNGLAITALTNAAAAFAEHHDTAPWLDAAAQAFDFVCRSMTVDGRLCHSWCADRARPPASIDDYAHMAHAALALFEATGEIGHLEQAERLCSIADCHYWDDADGGYFFPADDTKDLITRSKSAMDTATPAGNGTMVGVLARLYFLTGKDAYRARAERIVATFAGEAARNPLAYATLANGNELLRTGLQIVVVGDRPAADTQALLRVVHGVSLPNKVLSVVAPDQALPQRHPAHGKGPTKGRATAYVCRGTTCSAPLVEPADLSVELGADGAVA
ncbi:MAG: thioredoxin domain-containing protein [Kiloniellales bacterium]